MRRPTRGATTHPTLARPGMGYGRPLRPRPGPVSRSISTSRSAALLRGDVDVDEIEVDRRSVVGHADRFEELSSRHRGPVVVAG